MAENKNNDLTRGLSGKLGKDIIFVQRYGKTIARRRSEPKEGPGTVEQQVVKKQFRKASRYALGVKADPVKKAMYSDRAHKGISFFNRALSDFMKSPEVEKIDTTRYKGLADDSLIITAIDDFKVSQLKVAIYDPAGDLVEEGLAIQSDNPEEWLYAVSSENDQAIGSKIKATAYDLPGNTGSLEVTIIA